MFVNRIYLLSRKVRLKIFRLLLVLRGAKLHKDTRILGMPIIYGDPKNLTVGQGSTINIGVLFNLRDQVIVGNNVSLSPFCQIHSGTLDLKSPNRKHRSGRILLADKTWVASGAIVLPGVMTNINEVIAANSVRHSKQNI